MNPPVNRPSRIRPPARRNNRSTTRKPKFPKPNKSNPKIDEDLNMDLFDEDDKNNQVAKNNTDEKDNKNTDPKSDPTPKKENEVERKSAKESDAASEGFKRKPIEDYVKKIEEITRDNETLLRANFRVEIKGKIDKEGIIQKDGYFLVDSSGDQEMVRLAADAVGKIGQTRWLSVIADDEDETDVTMIMEQTDNKMSAIVRMKQPSNSAAKAKASAMKLLRDGALKTNRPEDEKKLLEAANFSFEDEWVVVRFEIEKEDAHEMITARLKEHREKKKQDDANKAGKSSTVVPNDKNAAATAGR